MSDTTWHMHADTDTNGTTTGRLYFDDGRSNTIRKAREIIDARYPGAAIAPSQYGGWDFTHTPQDAEPTATTTHPFTVIGMSGPGDDGEGWADVHAVIPGHVTPILHTDDLDRGQVRWFLRVNATDADNAAQVAAADEAARQATDG